MDILEIANVLDEVVKNECVVIVRLRNKSGEHFDVSFSTRITQANVSKDNITIYTQNKDDLISFNYEYIDRTDGKGYSKINFNTNAICLTVNIKY